MQRMQTLFFFPSTISFLPLINPVIDQKGFSVCQSKKERRIIWSTHVKGHVTMSVLTYCKGFCLPLVMLLRSLCNLLALKPVWSCDSFAFGPGNPFVCSNSPQQWCQQQTESGDTENQQVHLSGDDASPTCTAAQDEGELADLRQTSRDDPPNVSRARRQDRRQHQYGHHELHNDECERQHHQDGEFI